MRGQNILREYEKTSSLKDKTRIKLVNEAVLYMTNDFGKKPEQRHRVNYAKAVSHLFPNLVGGDPDRNYVSYF